MKIRVNTKFGMCTYEPDNDSDFYKVTFDKKVSLNEGLKLTEWIISRYTFSNLIKAAFDE